MNVDIPKPASLRELGLTADQSVSFQRLADVPETAIRAAVQAATGESRPLRKREIMEAGIIRDPDTRGAIETLVIRLPWARRR